MFLKDLIESADHAGLTAMTREMEVSGICTDSRRVSPGDLFVALPGSRYHGREFIPEALRRGARAVIVDQLNMDLSSVTQGCCVIPVQDPRAVLTVALRRFYGLRPPGPKVVGVTGTNGKTTVTYLLESFFHQIGRRCGVIGTVNYRFGQRVIPAKNTTPGIADNYRILSDMAAAGMDYIFMEVSSHALDQKRVDGIGFSAAVFTNLTQDHLDYHKNTEEYFKAKSVLFTGLPSQALAVINTDCVYGRQLRSLTAARVVSYGVKGQADIIAEEIHSGPRQTQFTLLGPDCRIPIVTSLFGQHNIYNILAAAALGLHQGLSPEDIRAGVAALSSVPGRMEAVPTGRDFDVFIDYAHTPDALESVLTSIREIHQGKVILVFGCGGDRDRDKRPLMGQIAARLADYSIVTNDNPRSEDPHDIARQIVAGFEGQPHTVILDRKQAIAEALRRACPGSVVLIAGKGHEDYQVFRDRVVPFREREILADLLKIA